MNIDYLANHRQAIPMLANWLYEEFAYLNPDRTPTDVAHLITERANTHCLPLTLVAVAEGNVIGTVCIKVHDMDTRQDLSPWLAGLYVARECRKRGVGTQLVAATEQHVAKGGIERLYLFTPSSEGFYAKLGWGTKEQMQYRGYPVTLMEKAILP